MNLEKEKPKPTKITIFELEIKIIILQPKINHINLLL